MPKEWDLDHEITYGETGTVMAHRPSGPSIGVMWDNHGDHRHNLNGKCSRGHGWYVYPWEIEILMAEEDEPANMNVDGDIL